MDEGSARPDARRPYEVQSFAVDEARSKVIAFGVFRGTNTGEGDRSHQQGNKVAADYVYVMAFDDVESVT